MNYRLNNQCKKQQKSAPETDALLRNPIARIIKTYREKAFLAHAPKSGLALAPNLQPP